MTDGVLYEPRSLWSIANVEATDQPQQVRLERRHFYNSERWPITMTRVSLMAVNYSVFQTPQAGGIIPAGVGANEAASVVNLLRFAISAPQRFYFNAKNFVVDSGFSPRPVWQPPVGLTTLPGEGAYLPSSLYGQCNLNFDKPLRLPRNGTVEWDLSAYTIWNTQRDDQPAPLQTANASAWMLYQEVGGLLPGSVRSRHVPLFGYTGDMSQTDPEERWPYPADGYGAGAPGAGLRVSTDWWPGLSRFPAGGGGNQDFLGGSGVAGPPQKSFAGQESTRAGSTELIGMRTFIDQLSFDQEYSASAMPFQATSRAAPLSMRVGTRVRTVNAGSKTWWWRPGAPLALVFDSVSPASVYHFPEPITLGPGEQLDVEMELPPNVPTFTTTYHVGLSINGYAAIEG